MVALIPLMERSGGCWSSNAGYTDPSRPLKLQGHESHSLLTFCCFSLVCVQGNEHSEEQGKFALKTAKVKWVVAMGTARLGNVCSM